MGMKPLVHPFCCCYVLSASPSIYSHVKSTYCKNTMAKSRPVLTHFGANRPSWTRGVNSRTRYARTHYSLRFNGANALPQFFPLQWSLHFVSFMRHQQHWKSCTQPRKKRGFSKLSGWKRGEKRRVRKIYHDVHQTQLHHTAIRVIGIYAFARV